MELTTIMKFVFRIPCNSGWLFHGFLAGRLLDNVSILSPIQDVFWVLHPRFLACVLIRIGLPRIGTLNEAQTSNYARIILARSLHLIAAVLDPLTNRSVWAFSLASDTSTHHGRSYLANRIHIHVDGRLYNLHLIAIPMYEHHTGENMFILIRRCGAVGNRSADFMWRSILRSDWSIILHIY